ncbi:MAG: hypothetical protein AAGD01_14655 [Acidobacteriota bacterium]
MRVVLSVLLLQQVLVACLLGQGAQDQQQPFATDLLTEEGNPYFLGAEALTEILAQDYKSLFSSPGVRGQLAMAHEVASNFVARFQDTEELDGDGCARAQFTPHRELAFLKQPEDFEIAEQAGRQTPLDLAAQAPEILVVRVVAADSGYLGAEMGTLVQFEIEEWVKEDDRRLSFGEPAFYFDSNVWLSLGARTYCQKREGTRHPALGDRYLIFGYRHHSVDKYFWTGNVFPLDGDIVLPNSYPLMDGAFPVSLEAVRRYAD